LPSITASSGAHLRANPKPEVKDQLLENTQRPVARGTFGSPTFYVGDEIFFGKDRLRDVEDMILQSR
jgi:2-hydroxychromene-2-carboxylate isomerase